MNIKIFSLLFLLSAITISGASRPTTPPPAKKIPLTSIDHARAKANYNILKNTPGATDKDIAYAFWKVNHIGAQISFAPIQK